MTIWHLRRQPGSNLQQVRDHAGLFQSPLFPEPSTQWFCHRDSMTVGWLNTHSTCRGVDEQEPFVDDKAPTGTRPEAGTVAQKLSGYALPTSSDPFSASYTPASGVRSFPRPLLGSLPWAVSGCQKPHFLGLGGSWKSLEETAQLSTSHLCWVSLVLTLAYPQHLSLVSEQVLGYSETKASGICLGSPSLL